MPSSQERRRAPRWPLEQPVLVSCQDPSGLKLHGTTRDLSLRGIFLYADNPITQGLPVQVQVTLPSQSGLIDPIPLLLSGRVVRVVRAQTAPGRYGAAIAVDRFEVGPEAGWN